MVTDALFLVIPILICLTFHELAHAFVAHLLGDRTAKNQGRLTLNPLKHIDPIGFIALLIFRFGWAKPVMVDMTNFKRPKLYMAITALAGPVSNIILAVIMFFIFGLVITPLNELITNRETRLIIFNMILNTGRISIVLAVFNMIPIPPLDGSKVLFSLLPERIYYGIMHVERYGFILLIIFINLDIFNRTVGALISTLVDRFMPIAEMAFNLVN